MGVEKEKVNAENAAAQVEADACSEIAKEVTELQARCEGELAAAEPLVAQAEEALNTLTKKDLGGCRLPACVAGSFLFVVAQSWGMCRHCCCWLEVPGSIVCNGCQPCHAVPAVMLLWS